MYQRIFVPVDDSDTSNLALAEACRLAKSMNSTIRLVHVVDLAQLAGAVPEFLDAAELQKSIKQAGEQVLGQAQAGGGCRADSGSEDSGKLGRQDCHRCCWMMPIAGVLIWW
jgi:hypothetical protein